MDDEITVPTAAEAWSFFFAAHQGGAKNISRPTLVNDWEGWKVTFTIPAEDVLP